MKTIDFNCDLGEGVNGEGEIMKLITSCNISCGFHAGTYEEIYRTIEQAVQEEVAVGAHPAYNDRENFGRKSLKVNTGQMYYEVLYQVSALHQLVRVNGGKLNHVKLHGALYNDAAKNFDLAIECFQAVRDVDCDLTIYGLPESQHEEAAKQLELKFITEAFADRRYDHEGFLLPRTQKGALIEMPVDVAQQVSEICCEEQVTTKSRKKLKMKAQTICFHGDHVNVLDNLRISRRHLEESGVHVLHNGN